MFYCIAFHDFIRLYGSRISCLPYLSGETEGSLAIDMLRWPGIGEIVWIADPYIILAGVLDWCTFIRQILFIGLRFASRISEVLFFRFLDFDINSDLSSDISSLNKLLIVPRDCQDDSFCNPVPVTPTSFSLFSPFSILLLDKIVTLGMLFSTIFDSRMFNDDPSSCLISCLRRFLRCFVSQNNLITLVRNYLIIQGFNFIIT